MYTFAIDPDALRSASAVVEGLVDGLAGAPTGGSADVGHEGLAAAVSDFERQTSTSWSARRGTTASIAHALRRTAQIYEAADDEAAGLAWRLGAPVP